MIYGIIITLQCNTSIYIVGNQRQVNSVLATYIYIILHISGFIADEFEFYLAPTLRTVKTESNSPTTLQPIAFPINTNITLIQHHSQHYCMNV